MLKYLFVAICICSFIFPVQAQDPQYSQFYAAPLYLNPAFAGSALAPRFTFNYRYQWPALDANYMTYAASFDHYFSKVNSGVALVVNHDRQGLGGLRSTDVGAQYSYRLQLSDNLFFQPGFQLSYVMRNINFFNLTFGDQFNPATGEFSSPTGERFDDGAIINYLDFSTGALVYTEQFWIGVSGHHLNRPNQSLIGNTSRLPIKATIHAGFKIPLDESSKRGLAQDVTAPERSITPAILYKMQGKFDQLDVGMYLTLEPVVFGLWYRGLPIKRYEVGLNNHDAAIFMVGYTHNNITVGYSYDLTVSRLGVATGGSHEISFRYVFASPEQRKKFAKKIPCPKF
jgi:type IX secretion system PorP/SprF family membrane protein